MTKQIQSGQAPAGWKLVPIVPDEAQWGGLPRDIIAAWEFGCDTPRKLFRFLERHGHEIPQWMREEQEMRNLDAIPSKGTRAVLVYRAFVECASLWPESASS